MRPRRDRDEGAQMTVERPQTTTWTIDRIRVTLRHSDPESVQVTIDMPRGGVASETRRRVVDEIVCSREVRGAHVLKMTIPLGDTDVLDELRKELDVLETRPAGASCLVDARPR